jgi:hypothetical protein
MGAFDMIAFVVFTELLIAAVVIVLVLGSLPAQVAQKRGNPQAAAFNVASWLGLLTSGVLWLVAMIWAFLKPVSIVTTGSQARNEETRT